MDTRVAVCDLSIRQWEGREGFKLYGANRSV